MSNFVDIERLWRRIAEMEEEQRFDGCSYPRGMCGFPFRLTGRGFFPGGDGLWREPEDARKASTGLLRTGGVLFLGNDFGTLSTFERCRSRGYENAVTWKHLKERIQRTDLRKDRLFFTNAILGLRSEITSKALDKRVWEKVPGFASFCRELLIFQIEQMQPRLIVVLGPNARQAIARVGIEAQAGRTRIGNHRVLIHYTTHPYGDFNFSEARKSEDAVCLQRSWGIAVND